MPLNKCEFTKSEDMTMMWRIKEVPKYSSAESRVAAQYYNTIRLALRRISGNIRFKIDGLQGIDMIIDDDSWVCVDRTLNDLPVVAWTDFNVGERNSLQDPVRCQLHYYHFGAATIAHRAIKTTNDYLVDQLLKTSENVRVKNREPAPIK